MDHDHEQQPSSSLQRIVREFDFFDEQQKCNPRFFFPLVKTRCVQEILFPPTMSKKRVLRLQETDDHRRETSPSCPDVSTDRYEKKRRTTNIDFDSSEGVSVYSNPRTIRLFGVNISIVSKSYTGGIDGDDQEKKISPEVKGKEKIINTSDQESKVDDANSQTDFFIADKLSAYRTKGIIVNEEEKKKKRQEEHPTAPVPPLFHPRMLEEISKPPVCLFKKKLETSDVASGLNRLFITRSKKLMGGLTEEERKKVEDKEDCLRVLTTDTQGVEYTLNLRKWHAVGMIVLIHDWCKFVKANRGCRKGILFRDGATVEAMNFV